MSALAQIVIALALFVAGGAGGIKWQLGVQARADMAAAEARQSDVKQQRQFGDKAATAHLKVLATINTKLGDAREEIATLSGRECFGIRTVGLLNAIGEPVRATAGEPASQAAAVAAGSNLRFATERDAAGAIATCRARYAEVSGQLGQILDIEEARHPP